MCGKNKLVNSHFALNIKLHDDCRGELYPFCLWKSEHNSLTIWPWQAFIILIMFWTVPSRPPRKDVDPTRYYSRSILGALIFWGLKYGWTEPPCGDDVVDEVGNSYGFNWCGTVTFPPVVSYLAPNTFVETEAKCEFHIWSLHVSLLGILNIFLFLK